MGEHGDAGIKPPEPQPAPIQQPKPESPSVAPTPQEAPVVVPKLQDFLDRINIGVDGLPDDLKAQFDELVAGKKEDGTTFEDKDYIDRFNKFRKDLATSSELELSDRQKEVLENMDRTIRSGDVTQEQILDAITGYVKANPGSLTPEQMGEISNAVVELKKEAAKVASGQAADQGNVNENGSKLFKYLKMLGIAILALFGFTLFKGLKSSMSQGGGQPQYH